MERRMPRQVALQSMEFDDLAQVIEIEQACFTTPWSEQLFVAEFRNSLSRRFVALDPRLLPIRVVLGYIIYWRVVHDEFHLMSIAVHPKHQHQGIGTMLMQAMHDDVEQEKNARIVLEVRATNWQAQELYKQQGYRPIGLRREYYYDNKEDALLMERIFGNPEEP